MKKLGKVKQEEIFDGLIHLKFPDHYLMASTFLRPQEHYESPKFRGKVFTLEDYADWYAEKEGAFTYYNDFVGFNMPAWVLDPFYNGNFNPLSQKEQELLRMVDKSEDFYLIATKGDKGSLTHEIAHGLYYLDPQYKRAVLDVLKPLNLSRMNHFLRETGGYHQALYRDEAQAYLLEYSVIMSDVKNKTMKEAHNKIRKEFDEALGRKRCLT